MNQKLLDYEKVLKVIQSCVTSGQNNTAYQMAFNFHNMYKDDNITFILLDACDKNLIELVSRIRR